ncbi:hypothetical protein [Mesorhizobium sp. M0227]|uniref:hypothetical protein n=1 Tax=Mesorhizobium sp. M0227 TaxID=2956922 RepID=UPI003338E229
MSEEKTATGEDVIVHVPPGTAKNVKIVETDPSGRGQDITIQVSRERKVVVSKAIGVIVK